LANDAVKFKFVTENKLLENLEINDSNNKSVIKDKVYTADDVEKMRLKEISKKSVVFDYVYAIKINSTINQVNVGKAKL
jgi:glutamine phosphoribosylpyrophosphate amidotransferase